MLNKTLTTSTANALILDYILHNMDIRDLDDKSTYIKVVSKREAEISKIMADADIAPQVVSIKPYLEDSTKVILELELYDISFGEWITKVLRVPINKATDDVKEQLFIILTAIDDKLKQVHEMGYLHCDMHAYNIVLNFTNDTFVRAAIIDWEFTRTVEAATPFFIACVSKNFKHDPPLQTAQEIQQYEFVSYKRTLNALKI
jgi:serine/threonine protein kinase